VTAGKPGGPPARYRSMRTAAFLLAGLMLASASAGAGLYKWTDSEGRVHYSDQPPSQQASERVRPGNSDRLEQEALAARRALADKLMDSDQQRRRAQEAATQREAEQDKARQKAERCARARERLQKLSQSSRVICPFSVWWAVLAQAISGRSLISR